MPMPGPTLALPARRPDLVFRPLGDNGDCVVKDPRTGSYYRLGDREGFLFARLDGAQTTDAVRTAYAEHHGEPLTEEDLQEFVALAEAYGFLVTPGGPTATAADSNTVQPTPAPAGSELPARLGRAPDAPSVLARVGRSILYWRCRLFDPDRLLARLEPKIRFVWTRTFLAASASGVLAAVVLVCLSWHELTRPTTYVLRWEVIALAWVTLVAVALLHEFAHGLTCKHYGGEVHEIGFLLLFLVPCFYCNVSDAWVIREKWKRLWVTLAGAYCDLLVWAAAVFVWLFSAPEGSIHYLAWVVVSVCAVRMLFNFNPLLKLDGYYLLSDWLEIPNLRQRAWARTLGEMRWLFGRAPRPAAEPHARFLVAFGAASWLFSCAFLSLMVGTLAGWLWEHWGPVGAGVALLLGLVLLRGLFRALVTVGSRRVLRVRHKLTPT